MLELDFFIFFSLYAFGCSNFIESLCFCLRELSLCFWMFFLCKNWKYIYIHTHFLLITQKFD